MDSLKMKQMLTDIKAVLNITPNKRFNIREKVKITLEHTTGQADRFTLLSIRLDNNNLVIQCSRGIVINPDKEILPYKVIQTLFDLIVVTNKNISFITMTEDRKYQIKMIREGIKCSNVLNGNKGINLRPYNVQATNHHIALSINIVNDVLRLKMVNTIHQNELSIDLEVANFAHEVFEKLFNICYANNTDVSFEYCPYCENEAVIPYQMKMGMCNHCGKPLAPCACCNDYYDEQDCANCPFNNGRYQHDTADEEIEQVIYIVDLNQTTLSYQEVVELTCDDFIELAEEQGNVNTFNGFMQRWNIHNDLPNPQSSVMRVYEQVKRL